MIRPIISRLPPIPRACMAWCALVLLACPSGTMAAAQARSDPPEASHAGHELVAKETLTAVEMDVGETIRFTLRDGSVRTFRLEDTRARVLYSNLEPPRQPYIGGYLIYEFAADVVIDGHRFTLRRYNPVQQSFSEPLVINGMRLWLDAVREIGDIVPPRTREPDQHPRKHARFMLQDATLRLAPERVHAWYPNGENRIEMRDAYIGADAWMGPYFGARGHGGLDINMPIGSPLWAPFRIDDHYYFESLAAGDDNNRWRGTRRWPNGDLWTIQTHHVVDMVVPEHAPIAAGGLYGYTAGVAYGLVPHSHFVFKVGEGGAQLQLDPWLLFWQIFEDNRDRSGEIRADMIPLRPARTGELVQFRSASRSGVTGGPLSYSWTFGDGGHSIEANPVHTYVRPGVYPVTLVVDDGTSRATHTEHITVDGPAITEPALALSADDPSFWIRPVGALDTYGDPVRHRPHTLNFVVRKETYARSAVRRIELENAGGGELPAARVRVDYPMRGPDAFLGAADGRPLEDRYAQAVAAGRPDWLMARLVGHGNDQAVEVSVDAMSLTGRGGSGRFVARIVVDVPGAFNSPALVRVVMEHPARALPVATHAREPVTVGIHDEGFAATPYFWLYPQFSLGRGMLDGGGDGPALWPTGHNRYWLLNGFGRADEAGRARFTPTLEPGRYRVVFSPKTPFRPMREETEQVKADPAEVRFAVRVRHEGGIDSLWVQPLRDREIGIFDFHGGTEGYVEVLNEGASGLVTVDAIEFVPVSG